MTLYEFRSRFPEFRPVSDVVINEALTAAGLSVSADVYRTKASEAIGYLTAHKLVTSPFGKDSRLVDDDRESVYWKEFARIRREVAPRIAVT